MCGIASIVSRKSLARNSGRWLTESDCLQPLPQDPQQPRYRDSPVQLTGEDGRCLVV
jgi:hypothetical protein